MARLTLSQAGEDVVVGGDVDLIGTTAGGEVVTVVTGNIRLDPSFSQGGDTVVLPGLASAYTAYRLGSEVIFTRNDGLVTLRIPIGSAGTEIQFDGGDSRTLLFNGTAATLEGQVIGGTAASPTPIGGGSGPLTGYDVTSTVASVNEGDAGTRQLVFTITLDRAVTAADGPITINYVTSNGTASSNSDYVAAAGTVTFAVGQTAATVTVLVNGDVTPEADETLNLTLSSPALRNGPETLVGTIVNDDNAVSLTGVADNLFGSASADTFFGANNTLGAGDKITDQSTTDSDTLILSLDQLNQVSQFGGFALTNIENFVVTNDDTVPIRFDLSSSTGIQTVTSLNSAQTVFFDQLTSLAAVKADNVTGEFADVIAYYQANVTKDANTAVDVLINDATANNIVLGTVGQGNTGIETVNLKVTGDSEINGLITDLTTLNVTGSGSVIIDNDISSGVRTINASGLAGDLDLSFYSASAGVKFTGATGDNSIVSSFYSDTITTFGGNDSISDYGGNDVIRTGAGNDDVYLGAFDGEGPTSDVDVDTGTGNDLVTFAPGGFTTADKVALGGDVGDVLSISESTTESDFVNVTGAFTLEVDTQATTDLGSDGLVGSDKVTLAQGEIAGIKQVNLNLDGNVGGNDTLLATDYVAPLRVNLGAVAGSDTVKLGSGNDLITTASFDNTDVLVGGKGSDTILVTDGATSVNTTSSFSGIENITYQSDADGDDHTLIVDNDNAPTDNGVLNVNASALVNNTKNVALAEQLYFQSDATTFKVNVTGGQANDTFYTANGIGGDVINAGAGDDFIFVGGGDTANGEAGKDQIYLNLGDNIANGGDDNDLIVFLATGNNTASGGAGDDRFEISVSANLDKNDTIDGGIGTDTLAVDSTYVDAQLTNVTNVEILEGKVSAVSNITLGAEAQEAGIRTVNLLNTGADVLDASKYTADLTVNSAGGDDNLKTGSGNDTVSLGVGTYVIDTGNGNDRILVSGAAGTTELDYADKIAAGAGTDTIVLDNTAGAVEAAVNLALVTGVENYTVATGGDRVAGKVDADANVLKFGSTVADIYTDLTTVTVDASGLTDVDDSLRVVIDSNLVDDDAAFTITGSATATTIVEKLNISIDNNINFVGGAGVDILRIDGADAGSTIQFNGNAGTDQIFITGGSLTDDGFFSIRNVEVLTGNAGTINAVLGSQAAASGLTTILGTAGNENIVFGAGFNRPLTVTILGGSDIINASASTAVITFVAAANDIDATDTLSGGSTAGDVINVTEGGSSNLNGVTQVETINVINTAAVAGQVTTLTLDALASEVNGGRITINASAGTGDSLNVTSTATLATAAALTVNGGAGVDTVQGGGGADIINGNAGADVVRAGGGNDTVNGGAGADVVRGELGNDTISGGTENDTLYGDFAYADFGSLAAYNAYDGTDVPGSVYPTGVANDTINGGDGNDTIVGGLGSDTLTGGAGADVFLYQTSNDSRLFPGAADNRDIITDFTTGVDKIDLLSLADPGVAGQTVRFNGNWNTFGEGQGAVSLTGGDAFLDVVYVRESNTLWVDVNNDGVLNGNDMQIILQGVTNLVAADVNNPHTVTGPTGFVPTVQTAATIDQGSLISIEQDHLTGLRGFDQMQFA